MAIPIPPDTTRQPVLVEDDSVVLVVVNLELLVMLPFTFTVLNVLVPTTSSVVPINTALAIPIPPLDTIDPDDTLVEFTVLVVKIVLVDDILPVKIDIPATEILPPINTFLAKPAPPSVVMEPVEVEDDSVVLVREIVPEVVKLPEKVNVPDNKVLPATLRLPPIYKFLFIPPPPDTINAPVDILVDSTVEFTSVVCKLDIPPISKVPVTLELPDTVIFPPIFTFLTIPIPPLTNKLPVVVEVDSVVSFTRIPPTNVDKLVEVEIK